MQAKASAQVLLNCNYAVELGKKMNFVLVGIDGNDIKSGNKKLILALCKKNVMRKNVIYFNESYVFISAFITFFVIF